MFSVPKILYGVVIAIVMIVALIAWPLALSAAYVCFPILVLLMLWDIMSGMNKIWRKLWEMDVRLSDVSTTSVPHTSS